jgi:TfoX/Sxy family transcriptional regulator of competence genes
MAYDEKLAERIRAAVKGEKGVAEKAMFGGIAWLKGGNMFVGTLTAELLGRGGKDAHDAEVKRPHARIMDFTGRPMKGYLIIAPEGVKTVAQVKAWSDRALAHVSKLPGKKAKPAPKVPKTSGSSARRK